MRRRSLLTLPAALSLVIIPSTPRAADARRIALHHVGSGARFEGIWHDGTAPDPLAMAELTEVLADPGATPPRPFDPEAIGIVWEVAARTRLSGALEVHSGFRTPRVNRNVHGAGDSQHLRASALDIGVPAGRMPAVADAALKLRRGGVGVYRQRGFIHLDSGPVRHWSDASRTTAQSSQPPDRIAEIAEAWRAAR